MPTWVWVLLGLAALGFVLRLLGSEMGEDETERYGKALAIFFILAILGGIVLAFFIAGGN